MMPIKGLGSPTLVPIKVETTPMLPPRRSLPKDISSLHAVRLLGCVHIILSHTLAHEAPHAFLHWGETWVSFFFLLSGFGPAYVRMHACPAGAEEDHLPLLAQWRTVLRRLAAVYPVYLVALLACVAVSFWARSERVPSVLIREHPQQLVYELFMLQA